MKMAVFGFLLLMGLMQSGAVASQQDNRIYYGTRAGMHLTTISKEGIGTDKAVIMLKHTLQDAKAFCVNYVQDHSMACVQRIMASVKVGDRVSGNCVKKTWVDMYDRSFTFLGRARNLGESVAEYAIRDNTNGQILNASMASGYPIQLTIFQQLCPGQAG